MLCCLFAVLLIFRRPFFITLCRFDNRIICKCNMHKGGKSCWMANWTLLFRHKAIMINLKMLGGFQRPWDKQIICGCLSTLYEILHACDGVTKKAIRFVNVQVKDWFHIAHISACIWFVPFMSLSIIHPTSPWSGFAVDF